MIYSNGCSFSTSTNGDPYPIVISKKLKQSLILRGYAGFSNRAIIRCTVRDILNRKNISLVLMGLTFCCRTEVWNSQQKLPIINDGHFIPLKVDDSSFSWGSRGYMNTDKDLSEYVENQYRDYYRSWAIIRNDHADTLNLLTDLVMLKGLLDSLAIDFRIFCNAEPLTNFILDDPSTDGFIKNIKSDSRFLWLFEDSFCNWARDHGFDPYDQEKYGVNGHPNHLAHAAFADKLLETI